MRPSTVRSRHHGVEEHVGRLVCSLARYVLGLVVGNTVYAGAKDEGGWCDAGDVIGVVPGDRGDVHLAHTARLRSIAHQLRAIGVEDFVAEGPLRRDLGVDIRLLRGIGEGGACLLDHLVCDGTLLVAHVDGYLGIFRQDAEFVWPDLHT